MAAAPRRLIGMTKQPLRNSWLKPTTAVQVSLVASILTTLLITFQLLDPGQEIDRSSGRHRKWGSDGGLFGGKGGGGGLGGGIVSSLLQRRNRTAISSSSAGKEDLNGQGGKDSSETDPSEDQWAAEEHFVPEIVSVDPYHAPAAGGETITIQGYALGAQIVAKKQRLLLEKEKSKTMQAADAGTGAGEGGAAESDGNGKGEEEDEDEDEQNARPEEAVYVLIGGTPCTRLEAVEGGDKDSWNQGAAESLRCIVPPGVGIRMNVQVSVHYETGEVKISRRNKLFSYDDPEVLQVSPTQCPVSGGCTITITGKNFGPADDRFPVDALVGGTPCSQTVKIMDSSLLCAVPRGTPGAKAVVVAVGIGEHHVESRYNRLFSYILTPEEKLDLERDSIVEGLPVKFREVPVVMHLGEVKRARPFETYFKDPLTGQTCSYSMPPHLIEVLPTEDLPHHNFDTCAVVGGHRSLYQHDRSVEIDSAAAVIRINLENSEKHPLESYGGRRADFRVISTAAVKVFLDRAPGNLGRAQLPYPFSNTRLIIWSEYAQDLYVQLMRTFHRIPAFFLSRHFAHSVHVLYAELSRRLERLGIVDLQATRLRSRRQRQQQPLLKDMDEEEDREENMGRDETGEQEGHEQIDKEDGERRTGQEGGVNEQNSFRIVDTRTPPAARSNLRWIEVKRENGRGEGGGTGKRFARGRAILHTEAGSILVNSEGREPTQVLRRRKGVQNVDGAGDSSPNHVLQDAAFGRLRNPMGENNTRGIGGRQKDDDFRPDHSSRDLVVHGRSAFSKLQSAGDTTTDRSVDGDVTVMGVTPEQWLSLNHTNYLAHENAEDRLRERSLGMGRMAVPARRRQSRYMAARVGLRQSSNMAAQGVIRREEEETFRRSNGTSFSTESRNLRHLLAESGLSGLARFRSDSDETSNNSSIAKLTSAHWTALDDSLSGVNDVEPQNPSTPSAEFYATMFAIQICDRVDLYGFPPYSKMDEYYAMVNRDSQQDSAEGDQRTGSRRVLLSRRRASRLAYRGHGQVNGLGEDARVVEKPAEDMGLVRDTVPTGPKLDLEAALLHLLELHDYVHVHY
ncbi:hypothetical protein CBR_g36224 [Chara braunii]|uniref:IPT/TIG domain-containing protein n=1 Tax=Chara braunii TaxID=69332 RepID=A0A388LK42_CHABU|nr:hypothetical protein CBR_g36224 [Chara braunii]|eukprot:GBG82694.1 hypothetical protein CBR_g36224 [Chara braunii]